MIKNDVIWPKLQERATALFEIFLNIKRITNIFGSESRAESRIRLFEKKKQQRRRIKNESAPLNIARRINRWGAL
jgi:elongation factor P--beta-lysine ligase